VLLYGRVVISCRHGAIELGRLSLTLTHARTVTLAALLLLVL